MTLSGEYTLAALNNEKIMEALDLQRSELRLCDVVLVAEGEQLPAHRCILAAASQYFASMFETNHFAESKHREVELHSINPKALKCILDAIYMGVLKLDTDIMYAVLSGADHFLLTEMKYACSEFMLLVLKSERSTGEAIRVRRSAELYSLTDVLHEADRIIASSFACVARSTAFIESSFAEVSVLLQSNFILEGDEFVFYEAAATWIRHDLEARERHLDEIMSCIRFPLMDSTALLNVIQKDELVVKSAVCQEYINEAKEYQLLPLLQSSMQSDRTRPRCTLRDTVIYCFSGYSQFKCYVPRYDKWYSIAASDICTDETFTPKTKHNIVVVGGLVYLCTRSPKKPDEVGQSVVIKIQTYSLETNSWKQCNLPSRTEAPMFVIECNNALYSCSRSALERYHPEQDNWEVISVSRLSPCQFAVSDENKIYLYAMEDGVCQEISMDRPSMVNTRQVMSPNRFVLEVLGATKLPNHEVLLSLKTMSGITRKIFNVKSSQWRDGNIFYGHSPMQARPGQHYPFSFDPAEIWEVLCDRNEPALYVLSTKSGLTNIPQSTGKTWRDLQGSQKIIPPVFLGKQKTDGILPFYRIDMTEKTWTRLASLPESMATCELQMCISDGQSSMGNAYVL